MNARFPVAPLAYSSGFYNLLLSQLHFLFARAVAHDEETERIILRSPNGTLYDVTVDDTGTIVTAQTEKTRA